MAIQANMDNYNPFNDILENGAKGGGMLSAAGSAAGWTVGGLVKIISEASKEDLKNKGLIGLLRGMEEKAAKQEASGNTVTQTNQGIKIETAPSYPGVATPGNKDLTIETQEKLEAVPKVEIVKGQVNSSEKPKEDEVNGDNGQKINPVAPEENPAEDTGEYAVNGVGLDEWKKWYEETRQAAWDREDQIRKETQEREDTAYQRAVADMQAAGINPNLMNVQPANSGGGITTATGGDSSQLQAAVTHAGDLIEQMIAQAFEGDENAKDRFNTLLTSLIGGITKLLLI